MTSAAQDSLLESLLTKPPDEVPVGSRERALLAYADVLTDRPASVTQKEIAALRDVGFDDRAIHDACAIIAYFAFVNRIADGLGVELESPVTHAD